MSTRSGITKCSRFLVPVRSNAHHKVATGDADARVAVKEKGEAAEHSPFGELRAVPENRTDTLSELLVEGHGGQTILIP